MYQDDSFFTLSTAGSAGLAALSLVLALAVCAALWWLARGRWLPVRLAIAAVLFAGFAWLSPQVYYAYYYFLFDDLPLQWVAEWPGFEQLGRTVTFGGLPSLSAHSQGAFFWVLVILALWRRGPEE